jgi:hypothetical protein
MILWDFAFKLYLFSCVQEQLFVSKKSVFDGRKPIRGGIPVVFPQAGHHALRLYIIKRLSRENSKKQSHWLPKVWFRSVDYAENDYNLWRIVSHFSFHFSVAAKYRENEWIFHIIKYEKAVHSFFYMSFPLFSESLFFPIEEPFKIYQQCLNKRQYYFVATQVRSRMALFIEYSPAVQEVPGSIPSWDTTLSDALCKRMQMALVKPLQLHINRFG